MEQKNQINVERAFKALAEIAARRFGVEVEVLSISNLGGISMKQEKAESVTNDLKKQIVINMAIEKVDEVRENAERGQLLDEIAYGTLFGEVAMLERLGLITEPEGIKLLNDVKFAYIGSRELER